jgi:hypothetical protein
MIAATELDELILSFCDVRWLKVARIFGNTMQVLEDRGIQIPGGMAAALDARLEALVKSGRLQAKGNIRRWRFSEVRLPAGAAVAKS